MTKIAEPTVGEALRQFVQLKGRARQQYEPGIIEVAAVDGFNMVHITRADPCALVAIEVVDSVMPGRIDFTVRGRVDREIEGILTFRADNRTVEYRVLGTDGTPWGHVVCERLGGDDD